MKTVLIATHQISFSDPESLYNCLGVLTLSSALKKRDLQCEVLDLFEFNNLYSRDCDEVLDSILARILESKPDLLGFSAMINNLPVALALAARVKHLRPEVLVVFGGPGTAFCARDVLVNFSQVDIIFRGEADFIFPLFVQSLENGLPDYTLPGLIYRNPENDTGITDNGWPDPVQNLDELPVPDFHFNTESFIQQNSATFGDYNGVSIETGRGCPFTCNFCSTSLYFKRKYRLKSIDRIISEIQLIKNRLGSARIIFNHDLFTLRRRHVLEFCDRIKNSVPDVVWKCHARLDTLDEEILLRMSEAGCNEIFVGLESATEKMQRIIQKKLDLHKFDLLIDIAERLNMRFSLSFIVGFPEEDDNDIREIFAYCLRAKHKCRDKVQVKIHSLVPLVGSPLYEEWKDCLEYDDYGCIGTTDIPSSWRPLRDIIKPHPGIFSVYFHFPIGEKRRTNSSKFGYIGLVMENLMVHSSMLAFEVLGETLADLLVKNIDRIILPPPSSLKNSEYHVLADSVRFVFNEALSNHPRAAMQYDALAQLEIAVLEAKASQDSDFSRLIETYYNPDNVLDCVRNSGTFFDATLSESFEKRYFLIFRDKSLNTMKTAEVPAAMALLAR